MLIKCKSECFISIKAAHRVLFVYIYEEGVYEEGGSALTVLKDLLIALKVTFSISMATSNT